LREFAPPTGLYLEAMKKTVKPPWLQRVVFALLALLLVIIGVGRIELKEAIFQNWWGEIVFVPVFIVIAFAALLAAFRPASFSEEKKKSRIRGWPTGRAKYNRNRSGLS
jgi:fatty acid desaturase